MASPKPASTPRRLTGNPFRASVIRDPKTGKQHLPYSRKGQQCLNLLKS